MIYYTWRRILYGFNNSLVRCLDETGEFKQTSFLYRLMTCKFTRILNVLFVVTNAIIFCWLFATLAGKDIAKVLINIVMPAFLIWVPVCIIWFIERPFIHFVKYIKEAFEAHKAIIEYPDEPEIGEMHERKSGRQLRLAFIDVLGLLALILSFVLSYYFY